MFSVDKLVPSCPHQLYAKLTSANDSSAQANRGVRSRATAPHNREEVIYLLFSHS